MSFPVSITPGSSSFVVVVCLNRRCSPLRESLAYRLQHYPQVGDSTGFATGGTSAPVKVIPSSDLSCIDPGVPGDLDLDWTVSVEAPIQCESVNISWTEAGVKYPPFVHGRPHYLYL